MYRVSHLNWKAAVAIRRLKIGLIIDITKREYGKNIGKYIGQKRKNTHSLRPSRLLEMY